MMSRLLVCVLVAIALFAPMSSEAREGPSAKTGFKKLIQVAGGEDAEAIEAVLPEALVEDHRDWKPEDIAAWREGFALELSEASVVRVSKGDEIAYARYRRGPRGAERVVRLRYVEPHWVIDCPQSYLASGRFIDTANGSGPAKCTLSARQKNGPYEGCAVSFAHATKDPEECKNRMDLWFCKYGDLHLHNSRARIAVAGRGKSLASVDKLEPAWVWEDEVTPKKGTIYVVHSYRRDHRDFYVRLKILAVKRGSLTFEWNILLAGPGAPTTIHEAVPLVSNDGADGFHGMCEESISGR